MNNKVWAAAAVALIIYMTTKKPRNVRNNNPLNLKEPPGGGDLWVGEHEKDLDPVFEEFTSPEYGFRAAYKALRNYRTMHGLNSIDEIVNRWAPKSDNNHTQRYIDYLCEKLDKWSWTPVFDYEMPELLFYMAEFEGAKGAFTMDQVEKGIALA